LPFDHAILPQVTGTRRGGQSDTTFLEHRITACAADRNMIECFKDSNCNAAAAAIAREAKQSRIFTWR
jgi:hypothetical protein